MPDKEQLGILCLLGLLAILYVVALVIKYVVEYWYLAITAVTGLIALRVWWRRRYPIYLDDDDEGEDGYLEPVPQE